MEMGIERENYDFLSKIWSSMRDLEVAKNTLPISIWGVPVRKWAGRVEYSHMGSPRFRIEFVSIWGLTYILNIKTILGAALENVSAQKRKKVLVPRTQEK
jgi:hypothetical protein